MRVQAGERSTRDLHERRVRSWRGGESISDVPRAEAAEGTSDAEGLAKAGAPRDRARDDAPLRLEEQLPAVGRRDDVAGALQLRDLISCEPWHARLACLPLRHEVPGLRRVLEAERVAH